MAIESINPARCRMWDMHDRLGDEIDVASCRSLIRSFQQNGQRQPALGRAIPDERGYKYELVYGARRLFTARHLGIELLVDVRDIDDRTALIEMDIENRVRTDICPYERGLSYRSWLRGGYFESQAVLATSVGVSEAQVSRLLRYAELPAAIVAAFKSPRDIREEWAVVLAKCCADVEHRNKMLRRARAYAGSERQYPPQAIYEFLVGMESQARSQRRQRNEVMKTSKGSPFMQLSVRARAIHLILPRNTTTPGLLKEITEDIRKLVEDAQIGPDVHSRLHTAGRRDTEGRSVESLD